MKLAIVLTLISVPAFAQTTATKPVVHHTTTAVHRPVAACADTAGLSPKIPAAVGCPKTLYALKYLDLVVGTGELAQPKKFYTVHYTGWLTDGTKFDSSVDRNEPITFPYGAHRVILGWDSGFEGMHVGGKRRLFIPYQLAYGEAGRDPIPPKAELVFDLELISQSDAAPAPPPAPPTPATPPDAAKPDSATPPTTAPAAKPAATPPPSN